jgi:hypothetical protein
MNSKTTDEPMFWRAALPIYLSLTNKFSPNASENL